MGAVSAPEGEYREEDLNCSSEGLNGTVGGGNDDGGAVSCRVDGAKGGARGELGEGVAMREGVLTLNFPFCGVGYFGHVRRLDV